MNCHTLFVYRGNYVPNLCTSTSKNGFYVFRVFYVCWSYVCTQGNMGEQPVAECFTLYKYIEKKTLIDKQNGVIGNEKVKHVINITWDAMTLHILLALWEGKPLVGFPHKRSVIGLRSFGVSSLLELTMWHRCNQHCVLGSISGSTVTVSWQAKARLVVLNNRDLDGNCK